MDVRGDESMSNRQESAASKIRRCVMENFCSDDNEHLTELLALVGVLAELQEKVKEAEELLKDCALDKVRELVAEGEDPSAVYWLCAANDMAKIVRDEYLCATGAILSPQPLYAKVYCRSCGAESEHVIKSISALRDWFSKSFHPSFLCDECREIEDSARKIHAEKQQERELELAAMPYKEYLKTPEWQDRRKKALSFAKYCCQLCNASGVQLDVHHRTYANRGNEKMRDLIVLCRTCHGKHHDKVGAQ